MFYTVAYKFLGFLAFFFYLLAFTGHYLLLLFLAYRTVVHIEWKQIVRHCRKLSARSDALSLLFKLLSRLNGTFGAHVDV